MADNFSDKVSYRRGKVNDFYHRLDRMFYRMDGSPSDQREYDDLIDGIRRDLLTLADDIKYFVNNDL